MSDHKMMVYSQEDIQAVMLFLNSLAVTGVTAARQISATATILESGKPLEDYLKLQKGSGKHGNTEPGSEGAD